MLWQVDPTSAVPLFEQLAAQVRGAIASGELPDGSKLPAAKQVAVSLDINLHTVLRAYQLLRDEGLVDLRRGRGAVVVADDPGMVHLTGLADQLLQAGRRLGLGTDQIVSLLHERG